MRELSRTLLLLVSSREVLGQTGGLPSHFIALNERGQLEVIDFPGGDATHARIFLGTHLYAPGCDLVPVTLAFLDVNGDHQPDLLMTLQGAHVVLINEASPRMIYISRQSR